MKCIICGENEVTEGYAEEHVIPDFLGGNYKVNSICQECNSKMGGKFENNISNELFTSFVLAFYSIKNRNGLYSTPSFIYKSENHRKIIIIKSDKKGNYYNYTHPQIPKYDDHLAMVLDIEDSHETIANIMTSKVDRRNRDHGYEKFSLKKNFEEKLKNDFNKNINIEDDVKYEIKEKSDLSDLIKLFVKIGYEVVYEYIGEEYLNDSTALKLRKFLKNCDKNSQNLLEKYGIECNLKINHEELKKCMVNVLESANENTRRKVNNETLLPPSNGNYLHQILFIFVNGDMFIKINLFSAYEGFLCVSKEGYQYIENLPIIDEIISKNIKIIKIIQTGKHNGEKFTEVI